MNLDDCLRAEAGIESGWTVTFVIATLGAISRAAANCERSTWATLAIDIDPVTAGVANHGATTSVFIAIPGDVLNGTSFWPVKPVAADIGSLPAATRRVAIACGTVRIRIADAVRSAIAAHAAKAHVLAELRGGIAHAKWGAIDPSRTVIDTKVVLACLTIGAAVRIHAAEFRWIAGSRSFVTGTW